MERFTCKKTGAVGMTKHTVHEGESFSVLRTIMNECVLITPEDMPNIITSEHQLRKLGTLSGTPALGGC